MPAQVEVLHAYRNIYRTTLRSIRYAIPGRYVVRDHLREAFRNSSASDFDARKISQTLVFLEHAGESRGFEHKLLKNLLHVWWWKRNRQMFIRGIKKGDYGVFDQAYNDFDDTLRRLNRSMGMCLQ